MAASMDPLSLDWLCHACSVPTSVLARLACTPITRSDSCDQTRPSIVAQPTTGTHRFFPSADVQRRVTSLSSAFGLSIDRQADECQAMAIECTPLAARQPASQPACLLACGLSLPPCLRMWRSMARVALLLQRVAARNPRACATRRTHALRLLKLACLPPALCVFSAAWSACVMLSNSAVVLCQGSTAEPIGSARTVLP